MKFNNEWEILFAYAIERLNTAKLSKNMWSFGGGTALMLRYNHRVSKDIDIFFRDPQLLTAISPRINDASEDKIQEYSEHTKFTKITFDEGEIDFIVSPQLTNCKPIFEEVCGVRVYIDSPVEIVAKKIHFRAEDFKPRDVFDLAVVCSDQKDELLQNTFAFAPQIAVLQTRTRELEKTGLLEQQLHNLVLAPGGEKFRGHEFEICQQFLSEVAQKFEKEFRLHKEIGA
jgi:predicted nucleotidyltransferase component of viral defense system